MYTLVVILMIVSVTVERIDSLLDTSLIYCFRNVLKNGVDTNKLALCCAEFCFRFFIRIV